MASSLFFRVVFRILALVVALFGYSTFANAETLDWNVRPATNLQAGATDTATFGSANETSAVTSGSTVGTFNVTPTHAIQPTTTANGTTGYVNSTIDATTDDGTVSQLTTIAFNEPVYNLSVVVGDIDGGPSFSLSGAAFNDIVEFRGLSPTNASVLPTSGTPVDTSKVTWTAATGRAAAQNFNVTDNTGNVTVTFAGPIKTLTIRHIAGPNSTVTNPTQQFIYIETVTFTRGPRLIVNKTTTAGVGTFNYSVGNALGTPAQTAVWSATTATRSVTTTIAGTPVASSIVPLFATATATAVTETVPAGWRLASASCGTLSGSTVTVPAASVVAGATITCNITNERLPQLTLVKSISGGGTPAEIASFTLTATGSTTISGASGSSNVTNAFLNPGTYALSESGPSNFIYGNWSCPGGSLSGSNLTLALGATVTCTVTNTRSAPALIIDKIASTTGPVNVGNTITYTYRVTNLGNVAINNVSISDVHNGYGVDPVPGSEILVTDAGPTLDSPDGGVNGVWDTLSPGDIIEFTATYNVIQADIDNLQ